jgi:hypothetical protein
MAVDDPSDGAIRQGEPPYRSDPSPEGASKHKSAPSAAEDVERHKRARGRGYFALFAIGTGLMFIFLFDGYLLSGLVPMPWVGWFVIGVGVLGLLGFNVFSGGPLDKRLDAPPPSRNSDREWYRCL